MLLNQLVSLGDLARLEAIVGKQLDGRVNPELGLAIGVLNVHMGSRFFAREKVKAIAPNPKDRRTHATRIAQLRINHELIEAD